MEYVKRLDGNVCMVSLEGKFTFTDHQKFREILDVFADKAIGGVYFDVSKVDFVDSAALGLFLLVHDAAKKHEKAVRLKGPRGQVQKMFDVAHFYELFDISE